jgi:hypothetical protein
MKLKYNTTPPSEGGAAVAGCGTIHKSEVIATLNKLSAVLELPFDLNDYTVGSTGKSEYSGDIDVVIDKLWYDGNVEDLHTELRLVIDPDDIVRRGPMLHIKYPIEDFNDQYCARLPRTGYVQVDFMFGDVEWERFFHYSHGPESGYKGFHRNIAISAITAANAIVLTDEIDEYGRPASVERWKWSPKGLLRIVRDSKQRGNRWLKGQTDTVIAGPHMDKDFIAQTIFPIDGTPDDLNSLETIIAAIHRNYPKAMQDTMFKLMADYFNDKADAIYFTYPPDIEQYFRPDDK